MARRRGERRDLCARAQDACATRSGSASSAGDWLAPRRAAPLRPRLGKSKVPAGGSVRAKCRPASRRSAWPGNGDSPWRRPTGAGRRPRQAGRG